MVQLHKHKRDKKNKRDMNKKYTKLKQEIFPNVRQYLLSQVEIQIRVSHGQNISSIRVSCKSNSVENESLEI